MFPRFSFKHKRRAKLKGVANLSILLRFYPPFPPFRLDLSLTLSYEEREKVSHSGMLINCEGRIFKIIKYLQLLITPHSLVGKGVGGLGSTISDRK